MNTQISTATVTAAPHWRGECAAAFKRDAHFLERLERLSTTQVDTALALYRDSALVKELLREFDIGDRHQRVAISIDDAERGPFIIVTREGQFVTCLGEGMRVSDTPVVTRQRFNKVTSKIQWYRELAGRIAEHPRREVERALRRILHHGGDVSREEFSSIAAWQPLLASTLLQSFGRIAADMLDAYQYLLRRQDRFKRSDETALIQYWKDAWALAHITMLLGSDGGQYLRSLADDPKFESFLHAMTWTMIRLNVASHTFKGAWLAARVGKPLLAPMKREYHAPMSPLHLWHAGLGLSAVGHAHRKLQAEIGKMLTHSKPAPDDSIREALKFFQHPNSAHNQTSLEHPEASRDVLNSIADQVLAQIARNPRHPSRENQPEEFKTHARALGLCIFLRQPQAILDKGLNSMSGVLLALPGIVRMKAEDFYMPRCFMKRAPNKLSVQSAVRLVEPRRALERGFRPVVLTVRYASPRPGRNDRCPCGSSNKYKRCCIGQAGRA